MRAARARSLRFGEMLARHLQRRQWVQGLSFGLSSAAALAVLAGPWPRVAAVLAGAVAVANAWGAAACPHQELVRLAALRSGWESLRIDCGSLLSSRRGGGARGRFDALQQRADRLGSLASSGSPRKPGAAGRWERFAGCGTDREA